MKFHIFVKNYPLCVVDVMWRSGLQKFSSYKPRCKQETTCSPLPMLQHELFLDFFLVLQFMFESFEMSSPSLLYIYNTHSKLLLFGVSRHTCPWCHVFQEMTALKYRLSKNNKQSEPEYLPCVHSSKHHCWLMLVKQYAYVTDWMQVTSPFKVREFVLAVWDVMMCIFIILWNYVVRYIYIQQNLNHN